MKLQWLVIPHFVKSGFKGVNTGCFDNFFEKRIPRLYNSYIELNLFVTQKLKRK